jgi:hypothetical protein
MLPVWCVILLFVCMPGLHSDVVVLMDESFHEGDAVVDGEQVRLADGSESRTLSLKDVREIRFSNGKIWLHPSLREQGASAGAMGRSAHESFIRSIRRTASSQDSVLHFYTDVIKHFQAVDVTDSDYHTLDALIEELKRRVPKPPKTKEEQVDALRTINDLIKKDFKQQMIDHALFKLHYMGPYAGSSYAYCSAYSTLTHGLGLEAGLPIYMVLVPGTDSESYPAAKDSGHAFVRIDPDGKHRVDYPEDSVNLGDFNWEATRGGGVTSDEYYCKRFGLPVEKRAIYMKNFDRDECMAFVYALIVFKLTNKGEASSVLDLANVVLKVNRKDPKIYLVMAVAYFNAVGQAYSRDPKSFAKVEALQDAISRYDRVTQIAGEGLKLDPGHKELRKIENSARQLKAQYEDRMEKLLKAQQ